VMERRSKKPQPPLHPDLGPLLCIKIHSKA
jgi:hypothetical protein